ncbi:hypothetical protein GW758_00970 [Candidatus Falkowbacteria bacterium]|nr:hypothetical protein [Candidatus Falkowbacteria bacterium]
MISYKHTQIGYRMLFTLIALVFFYTQLFKIISPEISSNFIIIAIFYIAALIFASFITLKVTIDESYLRIKFGYGVFSKKFSIKEIASVESVRNRWYHGWGVRLWFFPYMWIYNVSGFDAVEITMNSGRIYRIGTDESYKLEMAIKRATEFNK